MRPKGGSFKINGTGPEPSFRAGSMGERGRYLSADTGKRGYFLSAYHPGRAGTRTVMLDVNRHRRIDRERTERTASSNSGSTSR